MGASVAKNSTVGFFGESVGKTAIPSEFSGTVPSEMEMPKTHHTRVLGQTEMIGCVRCEKINCEYVGASVVKMGLLREFCGTVPPKMKVPKTHQTCILGQIEMIECVRCEKFNCEFFGESVGKTAIPREFCGTVPSEMKVPKTHQT